MGVDFSAIAPLIDQLAAKFGIAAEYLWGVLVKQAIADGIWDLVIAVTLAIAFYIGFRMIKWVFRKDENGCFETDEDFVLPLTAILGGTGLLLMVIFAICYFGSSIKHLLNPDYYAFMDIIRQIKQ